MQGCLAPSEIPGITSSEASVFGSVAENIIQADFCRQYACMSGNVFMDSNNPAAYLYFLASKNPHFTQEKQIDYFERAWGQKLAKVPDFLVHMPGEQVFYEVKPDSTSGIGAGVDKLGKLLATYGYYSLPYTMGIRYRPNSHRVAFLGGRLTVELRVRMAHQGLIVYKLCLKSDEQLEIAVVAALLAMIVREMNRRRQERIFRPIDLEPVFRQDEHLWELAAKLGLVFAATGVAAVGWSYFWKAVAKKFAVRGAAAAAMSAADGPLPVGELLSLGLAVWTVVDIIRLSDELWADAARLKAQGA